jgi:hypothetical protein
LLREPGASREGALPGYPVNLKREPGLLDPGSELQLTYTLLRPTLEGRFNVRVRFRGLPFRPFRLAGTVLYTVFVVGYLVAVRVRERRPSTAKGHRQRQHQRREQQRNALAHRAFSLPSSLCATNLSYSLEHLSTYYASLRQTSFSLAQTKTGHPHGEVAGCATGSIRPRRPNPIVHKVNIATGLDSYEAWREEDHDDLVLAVAMACWCGERYPEKRTRCRGQGS